MKVELNLFNNNIGCDHPDNEAICPVIFDGFYDAELLLFGEIQTDNYGGLFTLEYDPDGDLEKNLGIKRTPTLIFYDADKGLALRKLVKGQITSENVKNISLFLLDLEADPENSSGYVSQSDGKSYGEEDIIDMWGTGGWGFGLGLGDLFGGCPKWMPKYVCNFPFWIFTLIIILIVLLFILKLRK